MPIPEELVVTAYVALSEEGLRFTAEHQGIIDRDELDSVELVDKLVRRRGAGGLSSVSWHLAPSDLHAVAIALGIDTSRDDRRDVLRQDVQEFINYYDQRIAREEKARRNAHLPRLSCDELVDEAQELRRQVMYLKPQPTHQCAAIWSVDRLSVEQGQQLWISVDMRVHPDESLRRNGLLQVFVDDCDLEGHVQFREDLLLTNQKGQTRLYAHPHVELPSVEILFKLGSKKIQEWLDVMQEHGWSHRDCPDSPSFPVDEPVFGYGDHWTSQHALYTNEAYAQLGGWPLTWPEQSNLEQLHRKLVLRTYQASEPYVEVFWNNDRYEIDLRIT